MIREYIGARYVPHFTGLYDNTQDYEALDVVDNGSGTSYIAKKPTPAGTPLTDTEYWFLYGSANGAIVNLQNQINDIVSEIDLIHDKIVTPEMFGAVADGITDDSGAFNDAIAKGDILILSGTYLIDTININKDLKIIGIGATIKPAIVSGTLTLIKNAFTISTASVSIDGVTFEGYGAYTGAVTERHSLIDCDDCASIIITNCTFKNIASSYQNITQEGRFYIPILLKCVDVLKTNFNNNIIDTCYGDELFVITPWFTIEDTVATFNDNIVNNIAAGASFNLMANYLEINRNKFKDFNYSGSIFNMMCDDGYCNDNYFDNCTCGSVFDACEDDSQYAKSLTVKNNIYRGICKEFILQVGMYLYVVGNDIEAGALVYNALTSWDNNLQPPRMRNTFDRENGMIVIENNNVYLNNSQPGYIIRLYSIGGHHASDQPVSWYKKQNSLIIKNNTIKGKDFYTNKYMIQMLPLVSKIDCCYNIFNNPPKDAAAGSAKFLFTIDNRVVTEIIDMFNFNFNLMNNLDASLTGGVLIGWVMDDHVTIDMLNSIYNNPENTQLNPGFTATQYNTYNVL